MTTKSAVGRCSLKADGGYISAEVSCSGLGSMPITLAPKAEHSLAVSAPIPPTPRIKTVDWFKSI